jgi:hypothetical protein
MLINFTQLWERLPPEEYRGWSKTESDWGHEDKRREILHLLCGSLWHLELASQITNGDFAEANMEVCLGSEHDRLAPWTPWASRSPAVRPEVTVQAEERTLTIRYLFSPSIPSSSPVHFQTLLLADAALRLAGAYDLLPTSKRNRLGNDKFQPLLKDDGSFKQPYNLKISDAKLCLLFVIVLRDSFMHGENPPPDDRKRWWAFREKWFAGDFASNTPSFPYSPAIIAQACQKVWEEIVSLMT